MRDIAWLAGLLEGEATFGYFSNCPRVVVSMIDKDVIECAAKMMNSYSIGEKLLSNQHKQFVATAYGDRAVAIMKAILPYMGKRRSKRIKQILKMDKNKSRNNKYESINE